MAISYGVYVLLVIIFYLELSEVSRLSYINVHVHISDTNITHLCSTRLTPRTCVVEFLLINRTVDEIRRYENNCYHKTGLCHPEECECTDDCKTYILKYDKALDHPPFRFGCSATFEDPNNNVFRVSTTKLYNSSGYPILTEKTNNDQNEVVINLGRSEEQLLPSGYSGNKSTGNRSQERSLYLAFSLIMSTLFVYVARNRTKTSACTRSDYLKNDWSIPETCHIEGRHKRIYQNHSLGIHEDEQSQKYSFPKRTSNYLKTTLAGRNISNLKTSTHWQVVNLINEKPVTSKRSCFNYTSWHERKVSEMEEQSEKETLRDNHQELAIRTRQWNVFNNSPTKRKRFHENQSNETSGLLHKARKYDSRRINYALSEDNINLELQQTYDKQQKVTQQRPRSKISKENEKSPLLICVVKNKKRKIQHGMVDSNNNNVASDSEMHHAKKRKLLNANKTNLTSNGLRKVKKLQIIKSYRCGKGSSSHSRTSGQKRTHCPQRTTHSSRTHSPQRTSSGKRTLSQKAKPSETKRTRRQPSTERTPSPKVPICQKGSMSLNKTLT